MDVETHDYIPDRRRAPLLGDVAPDFTTKYPPAKYFRQGSHWRITDEEFEALAASIRESVHVKQPKR